MNAEFRHDEAALRLVLHERFVATFDTEQLVDRQGMLDLVLVRLRDVTLVARGGGNIVAQGGGNIIRTSGGAIVAQGGGN